MALLDATRAVYSSELFPIIRSFSDIYFKKLSKYFKMILSLSKLEEYTRILGFTDKITNA